MSFLQYTGFVKYEENNYEYFYRFKMEGKNNLLLDHYDEVPSPATDYTFQKFSDKILILLKVYSIHYYTLLSMKMEL